MRPRARFSGLAGKAIWPSPRTKPITDSWLLFHLTGADTVQIPQRAEIWIDLNYDAAGWRPWALGRRGAVCR